MRGSIFQTWLISKMKSHKATVEPILRELCELVNQDEFLNVMKELGLIKPRGGESKSRMSTVQEISHASSLPQSKGSLYKVRQEYDF